VFYILNLIEPRRSCPSPKSRWSYLTVVDCNGLKRALITLIAPRDILLAKETVLYRRKLASFRVTKFHTIEYYTKAITIFLFPSECKRRFSSPLAYRETLQPCLYCHPDKVLVLKIWLVWTGDWQRLCVIVCRRGIDSTDRQMARRRSAQLFV